MKQKLNPMEILNRVCTVIVVVGFLLFTAFATQIGIWLADRDAPFVMLNYEPVTGRPGDTVVMRADVKRDLGRRCSVLFSRSFWDAKGARTELTEGAQLMNGTALTELDRRQPGYLLFSVDIPKQAASGVGTVLTVLDYQCNPVHQVYPISIILKMDLEVKP